MVGKMVQRWWQLVRGGNVLLAGVAAWVGAYLTSGEWLPINLAAVLLTPMLVTAAGNIDNDVCDLEIDRLIKADRPLVNESIPHHAARVASVVLGLLGLAMGLTSGLFPLEIALVAVLGLFIYNRSLSGHAVLGNTVIAVLGALPILFGSAAVSGDGITMISDAAVVGAVIAFWLHLPREILKDALDIDGDRIAGRRTLAVLYGEKIALRWAALTMAIALLYVVYSAFCGCFGLMFSIGVFLTVIPALILGTLQCAFGTDDMIALRWTVGLKLCMVAGLAWMVIGKAAHP
jgi:geranylgeranylglycerol-phosphate geranylgeranyltransferase